VEKEEDSVVARAKAKFDKEFFSEFAFVGEKAEEMTLKSLE